MDTVNEGTGKKRKKLVVIVSIALALIVVCCLATLVHVAVTDQPAQEEPMDTPTATLEQTETPTDTPEPTVTPEPTATSEPTATPEPIATATPKADAGELAYIRAMKDITDQYAEGFGCWSGQTSKLSNDIYLMFDDDWITDTAWCMGMILYVNEQVRELEVPPRYQDAHAEMLLAAHHYDQAVHYYAKGVDEFEVDHINTSNEHLSIGRAHVETSMEMFESLHND